VLRRCRAPSAIRPEGVVFIPRVVERSPLRLQATARNVDGGRFSRRADRWRAARRLGGTHPRLPQSSGCCDRQKLQQIPWLLGAAVGRTESPDLRFIGPGAFADTAEVSEQQARSFDGIVAGGGSDDQGELGLDQRGELRSLIEQCCCRW
jgi:hypothetical protein